MNPTEAADRYCDYCRAVGKPEATIDATREELNRFLRRINKPLAAITVEDFVSYVGESKLSPATALTRYYKLKSFFRWLRDEGLIIFNPMEKVNAPKRLKIIPRKVMTKIEAEKLLETFSTDTTDPAIYRNRTMLELAYSCSLRRSELVGMQLDDYDPAAKSLRIRQSKTGAFKLVPIGSIASAMLDKYLNQVRPPFNTQTVFIDAKGQPINPEYITYIVCKARRQAKIRTKASSQSFRKTSATLMLKKGARIEVIQQLLGHARTRSTEYYAKVYPRDLFQMHAAKHPRERQKNIVLPDLKIPKMLTKYMTLPGVEQEKKRLTK